MEKTRKKWSHNDAAKKTEVHLDAVRRHLSIPRPTLPPCGMIGQCEESSRLQRRRKRSRREGGREGGGGVGRRGGEGQAEAVSGR